MTEHDKLISEVKRLLKEDGIFIVSTPNKQLYTDTANYHNPFHLRELYFQEFKAILSKNFKNNLIYGQKVFPISNIFTILGNSATAKEYVIEKKEEHFEFTQCQKKQPLYFIAISSNGLIKNPIGNSYMADVSETIFKQNNAYISNLEAGIRQRDTTLNNLEAGIRQRDTTLNNLEAGIRQRDTTLNNLEAGIRQRDTTLNKIYKSRGWKVMLFYYKVRDTVFLRRNRSASIGELPGVPDRLKSFLRRQAKKIVPEKVREKVFKYPAIFLVKQYLSSPWIRKLYASAKNISIKTIYPISPKIHDFFFVKPKSYSRMQYFQNNRSFDKVVPKNLYNPPKSIPADFNPKVSVIVPNCNHAAFLRQRLDTIYNQTYRNFEVILLDNASKDGSRQILQEYQHRYPEITKCSFNEKNSGAVFKQWRHGFEMADGDLIWVAESDDYCSENLLSELVKYFVNESVMLSYCRSVFVKGTPARNIWSLEEYLMELDPDLWHNRFIMSAQHLVNRAWAIKNIVPNVSSAVFRHPGKLELLDNEDWQRMQICGDWVFYLHLIRGGLVAYTPHATNYYRLHPNNTSVSLHDKDIYYQEHEKVTKELLLLYRLDQKALELNEIF